jgi:hypothetical protein
MGEKIRDINTSDGEVGGYLFYCPGCKEVHMYSKGRWDFNGDYERPTFKPSLLYPSKPIRCHIFMTDGMIQYLSDCGHELAGKTIECPDWDEDYF